MSKGKKIFISLDIEGVAGIAHWNESKEDKKDYNYFCEQMTLEAVAAAEGAVQGGAVEILVKDAHNSARNINPRRFPQCATFHRGWSGHPFCMMDGIDATFDGAVMVGYHARSNSLGSPLAHTMSTRLEIFINGKPMSEFAINDMTAAYVGVPTVFVSGDAFLCDEIQAQNPAIHTVATQTGQGDATLSLHPDKVIAMIRQGVEKAVAACSKSQVKPLPEAFELRIKCFDGPKAYARSFYPGARLENFNEIVLDTKDYFEILRALQFMTMS